MLIHAKLAKSSKSRSRDKRAPAIATAQGNKPADARLVAIESGLDEQKARKLVGDETKLDPEMRGEDESK